MIEYVSLFFSALLAATIVPFYSEAVLFALINEERSTFLLVLVAATGNTLGAVINWLLGKYLIQWQDHKWFPFKKTGIEKAQYLFNKYGVWTLLLSWSPVGGDALTFIAGLMRVNFAIFFVLVFTGKLFRYIAVAYLAWQL